jgi:hypothetical protein
MLDNHLYDLMIQLVQENKSLWRIKKEYLKNSEGNSTHTAFWKKMEADKESHIEELLGLVKEHLK